MIKWMNWTKGVVTSFTGRNGNFKCTGIEVMTLSNGRDVMLSPLTSKGEAGRCDIEIPLDDVPALIRALREAYKLKSIDYTKEATNDRNIKSRSKRIGSTARKA